MEEIVKKGDVPPLPEGIKIRMASRGALPGLEIQDLSEESIRSIVEKVRTGKYRSVMMAPDEENEEGFLELESSDELIFLQIWDAETETSWACFDPELLDSNEEAPITPSDGQSVFPMKCTMRDRELAAKCVEWYAHTLEPYPGMDWLKESFS
ncbi:hypothetical protein AALA82_05300 [Oscillospiraceae bacterium 50-16]